jgi:cold shock CspA family protein
MARGHETSNKKDKEKNRQKKRKEKELKKEARKLDKTPKSFEDQIAYVDEFGRITSEPPDPTKRTEVSADSIELSISARNNMPEVQQTGVITFFNTEKGFGFIQDAVTKDKIFFHISGIIGSVKENDKVSFETRKGQKGPEALNVTLLP